MTDECISASVILSAPAGAIFATLTDPTKHAAISGTNAGGETGWVREAIDPKSFIAVGQIVRDGHVSLRATWRKLRDGQSDPGIRSAEHGLLGDGIRRR